MHPAYLADINCEDFVLLLLLVSITLIHFGTDLVNLVSCTNGQKCLNVVHREEFINSLCRARGRCQVIKLGQVSELRHWFFALTNFVHVLKDKAGSLLGHDCVGSLERWERCDVAPPVTETG